MAVKRVRNKQECVSLLTPFRGVTLNVAHPLAGSQSVGHTGLLLVDGIEILSNIHITNDTPNKLIMNSKIEFFFSSYITNLKF